jgi:cell division protein FtsL
MSTRAQATSPAGARGEAARHRGRIRLTPRAAVLFCAIFLGGIAAIAPARSYLDSREEVAQLQRQADRLSVENQALQARIADLSNPQTLERLARECLGMVRPGQIAFVTIPKGKAPTPPNCG